ncbi:MAG: lipid A export permease/ATP-binding protein MsbA [Pseudomonadales bacterium]|nr:lipid A export permease/ATP-binding protein MsbA [Pseudomonadales bacterium]MCP5213742.1 lipid A export permease/ATP-binding protein MsbA [Pseudomonadales bacterium]
MTEPNQLTGWQAYKRLLVYVGLFWGAFLLSVMGFALYASTQAAFASLMEFVPVAFEQSSSAPPNVWFLPDAALTKLGSPESYQYFLPLAVVGIVVFRGVGSYFGGYYIALVARNVVNRMRQDLFNHMLTLPGAFFGNNTSGHLISTLTFNVEQITGAATDALKVIIREGLTVVVLLAYIFWLNWKLSLIFLIVGPFVGLIVSYASKLFRKYSRRIQDSMGGVTHVASEAIKGFQVVRAFGGKEYERARFQVASSNNLKQSLKLAKVDEISTPIIQVLMFSSIAILFWFGLSPGFRGEMDIGEFLAYITAASLIAKPLKQLTSVNAKIQRGIAAAQSIFAITDQEQELDEGTLPLNEPDGRIEFRDLTFSYTSEQEPVLSHINLTIEPGETLALVGRSGSGKSTLVNLLPRFYEALYGQILIDGHPIQDYCLKDLRKHIAIVNQDIVLFQDTVARNIAYGDLADASQEAIDDAARAAHATEFIDTLPLGMNTQIGEDGVTLSGGQRQRLALARAILKDAPILILDEATSALDTESERFIQEALKTVVKGRTTLVIAHRLSTIENANRIAVMDKGCIVELGTHEELLAKDGAYAQLYRMQFNENASA